MVLTPASLEASGCSREPWVSGRLPSYSCGRC